MTAISRSPASSGPAGSYFEGQIGAYYLLSMLVSTAPRGLPGTLIDRIEFQRAAEGHPLDDVIVHGHDACGNPAVLELQVKRSITFTPSDPIFRAVVDQIVETSRRHEFWTSRCELGIVTARTSQKINGPYQDVLTWARQLDDATTFMARIGRPGSANPDMRTFVQTFKANLHEAGSPDDNETIWRLLRKVQILVFDFTAQGSISEELAKERAAHALHPDDSVQAANLWATLVELALQIATSGGDRTRERLIEDLRQRSFRLSGDRRFTSVRAALAEASSNALADIGDRVADVKLARLERVTAVHAALDNGRYVEIRGDAGVGKSGILKHFAEQIARETSIIVLSPGRITPKGWTDMRAVLGFDGTAHDLLTDLASDGGAVLFLDNLDFFDDEEQRTVIDLVRETVNVPGCVVISTARRNFGIEEQNWLPPDILERLGRAEPIVIGELSEAEVDELRYGSPKLAPLLAETHPARAVIRNLYRLARLASLPRGGPILRTEIDMAELWWRTADGKIDSTYRERARLLRVLAEQALSHAGPLDVSNRTAEAVDALLASETLRDLGNDHVSFRHDVLREWAIANLLYAEPTMIGRLPIHRPAPVALARGVELTARIHLERSDDSTSWQTFVECLSDTAHGSWRRAGLLALVRSEIGPDLLARASDRLLANSASMLRELIRLVMAVDVEPASKLFASAGIDPSMIPAGIHIPNNPSWYRLISWLLSRGKDLPVQAIPDVVDLYTAWSMGTMGLDPLTPSLVEWLYHWLTEIETARETEIVHDKPSLFSGKLDEDRFRTLESNLRTGFLSFCNRKPALAVEYLRSLIRYQHNEEAVRNIMKFRGSLAQAAPAELAELTAAVLIPKSEPERYNRDELRNPFDYVDHQFFPVSPAQGPFFELLTHAPHHGLSLIYRLIDHAIFFKTHGRDCGTNAIIISFPDGERSFPWKQSYGWSRDWGGYNNITSGLMALEAWAHRRIEAGEVFDNVLADVLGPHGSPAAYLLVAVDLILSHWPKSREAAVPYLACPELLCIDRERQVNDNLEYPDLFGLKVLQNEPVGAVRLDSLRKRVSRQISLDMLLSKYVFGPSELREKLFVLLHQAAIRLGPPDTQSDLGDANFMVVRALNLLDPNNWREASVALTDGTPTKCYEYVSPESESLHLEPFQDAARVKNEDLKMESALACALRKPSGPSTEFVVQAVEWAQNVTATHRNVGEDEKRMQEEAIVTAAMVLMRDGDPELRERHRAWAYEVFTQAVHAEEDPVHRFRAGLRFNPVAIAFAGMIHGLKDRSTIKDIRILLKVAASGNPAATHGFGVAAVSLNSVDERLPRSVLRCAFTASIRTRRQWDQTEEEVASQTERNRERIEVIVDTELAWLDNRHPEPDWPDFPSETNRRRRRGIRLPGGRGQPDTRVTRRSRFEEYADHQAAALWLRNAVPLIGVGQRPWIIELVRTYSTWTFAANGAGLDKDEEIDRPPSEWNDAYFDVLARCLPGLTMSQIRRLALVPITSLPDEPFFDVATQFARSVDEIYFEDSGLQEPIATGIRSALADRLTVSRGWHRLCSNQSSSIEIHIAPAIAVLFFNDYGFALPSKCYLYPKGIDRLGAYLPILEKLVIQSGRSLFVTIVTLNLLEVSPKPAHLPFMVMSAKTWLESYADSSTFWVDNDIGRRVCAWIEGVWRQEPALLGMDKVIRMDVDRLLAALVSLGVADARRLEEALANR